MPCIIFVHGTGVREESYNESLAQVREAIKRDKLPVVPCYWGHLGVKLNKGGISIPDFDATRSVRSTSDEDQEIAGWAALYADPLWEFRLLLHQARENRGFVPNRESAFEQMEQNLRKLEHPEQALESKLRALSLWQGWREAVQSVRESREFRQSAQNQEPGNGEFRETVARSLAAAAMTERHRDEETDRDWISGEARDELVALLVAELGGQTRGIKESLFKTFSTPLTWLVRRRRGKLSEQSFEKVGDILLYQARGESIRSFIREAIEKADAPVTLLTHSLGGIAAVDLLIEHDLSGKVQTLITVGSQSPLFYEMNALVRLPFGQSLPAYFPKRWLNIYDPRDFLSYLARGVFHGPEIKDVRVNNRQPFPQSHSSYWTNPQVWEAIGTVLE